MAPKIVDREEKKAQIAHAAGAVFGDRGFDRTRIDDIARAAGVGKGTVYQYFADKQELFDHAFAFMMSSMEADMRAALSEQRPPLDTLREITAITIRAMEQLGHGYRFFLEYMLHNSREGKRLAALEQMLLEYRKGTAALLSAAQDLGQIRPELDTDTLAAAFAAWFDGAVFHWIVLPESSGIREMADAFLDLFFTGIAPRAGEGEGR